MKQPYKIHRFKSASQPLIGDTQRQVTYVPKQGDTVYTQNHGKFLLASEISSGGEGAVYRTDRNLVVKIFKERRITEFRYQKLQLMKSHPITFPGVCWPLFLVYNKNGEFVGYAMNEAEGRYHFENLFEENDLRNRFPR